MMPDPLDVLLSDGVIDEVLGRLKSGKEANISLVRRGEGVLAAKVYKDRATRSFKNNAEYKEGRKVRNTRTQRAMDSGGRFGRDAAEQAWKSAEADALYRLVGSGVRVPTPVMFYEGVLLMELVKDGDGRPAPRMIDVAIEPAAAMSIYADLVAQMIAMLCRDLIHGDLSPYNILAAGDGPTIIDFPQVVSAVHSSRAEYFFLRDFDNVVQFVSGFDPALKVHRYDGRAIWRAYVSRELTCEFVPPPPPPQASNPGPGRRHRQPSGGSGAPRDMRDNRSDPRRPPDRSSGSLHARVPPPARPQQARPQQARPQQARPQQARPQQARPRLQDDARSPHDRSPAPHPQRPPARESAHPSAASPPASRGRRRRPKRRW
jgi:RIO kinase 1